MAFEATAVARQELQPGQSATFTATVVPCNLGIVNHSDESPTFVLAGSKCRRKKANYFVDFAANIAGAALPASTMIVTPAAVENFFNVSRAMTVPVFSNCCQTLTVTNTSTIPIAMANANIVIDRPDLR